jgi:hypothetical protein
MMLAYGLITLIAGLAGGSEILWGEKGGRLAFLPKDGLALIGS